MSLDAELCGDKRIKGLARKLVRRIAGEGPLPSEIEVPAKEVQLEIKTVTADELREQEEKKKPIYARAFVNTVKSDLKHAGQYRSIDKALSDKESRRIVLENALYEFKRLATKYSFLKELELVKDAIEEVEQKIESA